MVTNWSRAAAAFSGFGGEEIFLRIPRSGLPLFDALQLYGAIDLYIGPQPQVTISDCGDHWTVTGCRRPHRLSGKDRLAFGAIWGKKNPDKDEYCDDLLRILREGVPLTNDPRFNHLSLGGMDRSLQAGIRGVAAASYDTLKSAQTGKKECIATVSLSQAMLANAGRKRILRMGDIYFLPIFEGEIDFSKVVNPLRLSLTIPNVLCAQALAILALTTSLLAEGYQSRLSAVVFETNFRGQRSDNYSGIVSLDSTVLRHREREDFVDRLYRGFRALVESGWNPRGREFEATKFAPDALSAAQWLMKPVAKHLDAMITSQERLFREQKSHFFETREDVKEVFTMSHPAWQGDPEAVRKYARAVASAIYFARMADELDRKKPGTPEEKRKKARKKWYDEITMLRSASDEKTFFDRAQILIEQGRQERDDIGTQRRGEAFDPPALLTSARVGDFDTFKRLFRMYLVQESTWRTGDRNNATNEEPKEEEGENE